MEREQEMHAGAAVQRFKEYLNTDSKGRKAIEAKLRKFGVDAGTPGPEQH